VWCFRIGQGGEVVSDLIGFGWGFSKCVGGCVGFWSGFFTKFVMFQFLEVEIGKTHFTQ
jgi:hypothetical protein